MQGTAIETNRVHELSVRRFSIFGDGSGSSGSFVGDVCAVAGKDMRIGWRSRAVLGQVLPFALLVLVLFGFGLDANRPTLRLATSGLVWMTVLFAAMMAAQNSQELEADDGAGRFLLLSGISPQAIFFGKAAAVAVQLLVVELALVPGVVVFYGARIVSIPLAAVACVAATVALAAASILLAAVVVGARARRTVLPVLLIPMALPVLIAAARAFDDALGVAAVDGWAWVALLIVVALANLVVGAAAYSVLLEDV